MIQAAQITESVFYFPDTLILTSKAHVAGQDFFETQGYFMDISIDSLISCSMQNEHFGIVPLEAMAAHKPVVACRSGGPVESIQHGRTGYLCEPTPPSFASAMSLLLEDTEGAKIMGQQARQHVMENFSRQVFGERLNSIIHNHVEEYRS